MSSDFNDDVLKIIGLGKVFGTGEGTEVGLEAISMEELDDISIELATGNIILVMLEDFERAFERFSKLDRCDTAVRT